MEEEIVVIEDNNIEEINIEEENYSGKPYELPIASKDVLGGIKVGENLTISEDGTLNAKASGGSSETNLMSLQLTTKQGFPGNTYTKIKFNSVVNVGEKLIFEDNGVKIGKGVKYVKVSAIGNPITEKTGNAYLRIVKNQLSDPNTIVWVFEKVTSAWGIVVLALPPKLVEVAEGDILYAYVYGEGYTTVGQGQGAEMSLTVEAVG